MAQVHNVSDEHVALQIRQILGILADLKAHVAPVFDHMLLSQVTAGEYHAAKVTFNAVMATVPDYFDTKPDDFAHTADAAPVVVAEVHNWQTAWADPATVQVWLDYGPQQALYVEDISQNADRSLFHASHYIGAVATSLVPRTADQVFAYFAEIGYTVNYDSAWVPATD